MEATQTKPVHHARDSKPGDITWFCPHCPGKNHSTQTGTHICQWCGEKVQLAG